MPKKKLKFYYDPRLANLYSAIDNAGQILDYNAQLNNYVDVQNNNMIDTLLRRLQEYERKMQEERRKLEYAAQLQLNKDTVRKQRNKFTDAITMLNPVAGVIAKGVNAIVDMEAEPNKPEDYGVLDLFRDNYEKFMNEMNHLQAESARGGNVALTALEQQLLKYDRSLDLKEEIDNINGLILNVWGILGLLGSLISDQDKLAYHNLINELRQRRQQAANEYNSYAADRKALEDSTKQSDLGRWWDTLMLGNKASNGFEKWSENIFGKNTAFHNQLNDVTYHLSDLTNPKLTLELKRNRIKNAISDAKTVREDFNEIVKRNEAELTKYNPTDWFNWKYDHTDTNLLNADTYLYKLGGLLGGSASSWTKQAVGMGATLATAPTGAGVLLGGGVAFNSNYSAGRDENRAELFQAVKKRYIREIGGENSASYKRAIKEVRDALGTNGSAITDDLIIDLIIQGNYTVNDPKANRALINSMRGLDALMSRDMAATTWDATIDTAILALPIGLLAKGAKWVKGTKLGEAGTRVIDKLTQSQLGKLASTPMGREILKTSNKGRQYLQATGIGGIVSGALGGAALGSAKYGLGRLGNKIVTIADGTKVGALGKSIASRVSNVSKYARNLADRAEGIIINNPLKRGITNKYVRDAAGRISLASMSEGIEEGKQHTWAEMFENGELDDKSTDMLDVLIDDTVAGHKLAAYITGMPLEGIGLLTYKDQDLLLEIKGGMIGGAFHTGSYTAILNAAPYVSDMSASDILTNNLTAGKLEAIDKFDKYKQYAKSSKLIGAGDNSFSRVFDYIQLNNEKYKQDHGEYMFDPEDVQKERINRAKVRAIALDPLTRKQFEGNKKHHYSDYVAVKAMLMDSIDESADNVNNSIDNLNLVRNSILQKLGEQYFSRSNQPTNEYDEEDVGISNTARRQDSMDLKNLLDTVEGTALLAALYQYRAELEAEIEAALKLGIQVKKGIYKHLDDINKQIKKQSDIFTELIHTEGLLTPDGKGVYTSKAQNSINTMEDIEEEVIDEDVHQQLKDAYLELYKNRTDYELDVLSMNDLIGLLYDTETGEIVNEDNEDIKQRKNLKKYAYRNGTIDKFLDKISEREESDDDLLYEINHQAAKDDYEYHTNDLRGNLPFDGNGVVGTLSLVQYLPFTDESGKQMSISLDENGNPEEDIPEGAVYDDDGNLWRDISSEHVKTPVLIDGLSEIDRAKKLEDWQDAKFLEMMHGLGYELLPSKQQPLVKTGYPIPSSQTIYEEEPEEEQPVEESVTTNGEQVEPETNTEEAVEQQSEELESTITDTTQTNTLNLFTKQEQTIAELKRKSEEDNNLVLREYTTGQDYFIKDENGIIHRYSRVHAVKPEPWVNRNEKLENSIYDSLISAYGRDIAEAFGIIDKLTLDYNNKYSTILGLINLAPYLNLLTRLKNNIENNSDDENMIEVLTIFHHIAKIISSPVLNVSVKVGSIHDALCRILFGEEDLLLRYTLDQDGVIADILNRQSNVLNVGLFGKIISKETLLDLINQIIQIKSVYDQLGWLLLTTPFTWHAEFEGVGRVCGETDMIGVDKEGRIHIIDFKTSYKPFLPILTRDLLLTDKYSLQLNKLNSGLNKLDLDAYVAQLQEQVSREIGEHAIVNKDGGIWVISTFSSSFTSINNPNLRLSLYDDYINLQTIYADLIYTELGLDVASMELLPFLAFYLGRNTDMSLSKISKFNNFVDGKPYRIVLPMNIEMHRLLTNSIRDLDNDVEERRQLLFDIDEVVEQLGINIDNFLSILNSREEYQSLPDSVKAEYLKAKGEIQSIIDRVNLIGKYTELDLNFLRNLYDELDSYLDKINTINEVIQVATELAEKSSPKPTLPQQEELAQVRTDNIVYTDNNVYAPNKIDRGGPRNRTNLNYRLLEANDELGEATIEENFITDSVIEVYSEGDNIYADVTYKSKTYKHILVDTTYKGHLTEKGAALLAKVKVLEALKQEGLRIVATRKSRTNGRIVSVKNENGTGYNVKFIQDTDLFAGDDMLDVEFSRQYGKVGFVNGRDVQTFDGKPSARIPIYTFKPDASIPPSGTMIFLKKVRHAENSNTVSIPVTILKVHYSKKDIDFIVDLLLNQDKLDRRYNLNGTNVFATGALFASLLIPIVYNSSNIGSTYSIWINPNNHSQICILTRKDVENNTTGAGWFDLSKDGEELRLRDLLATLYILESHEALSTRVGGSINSTLPFLSLSYFFLEQRRRNTGITSIEITDHLKFDQEDFYTSTSKTGARRVGISGFGWYVKNNIFATTYDHLGFANVGIEDVDIEGNEQVAPTVEQPLPIDPGIPGPIEGPLPIDLTTPIIEESDDFIDPFLGLFSTKKAKNRRINVEKARRRLNTILGEDTPVEFKETILGLCNGDAAVLGVCREDGITLSELAEDGVEFHEAFHKVLELMLPLKLRDTIYKLLAKRNGITLSTNESYKEVAEYAADKFFDYAQGYIEVKLPFNIQKVFNKIRDWVLYITHFSERDLYKVFSLAIRGEYRNNKPTPENVQRFILLFQNGLHYEEHGVLFKYIMNSKMYDNVKNSATYVMMMGAKFDHSGSDIQNLGTLITKLTFDEGLLKINKAYDIDVLGKEGSRNEGLMALAEFYDNLDVERIRLDIIDQISSISTDYKEINNLDNADEAQSGDVTNSSIGEHTRSSYEFNRFENATSRVRFFMATIPDVRYITIETTDQNGNKIILKKVVLAVDEFGLPHFVPMTYMFNEFLNNFHNVDTVQELLDELTKKSNDSAIYKILRDRIQSIVKSAYDPITDKVNPDQEALMVQLITLIRSNKHNFDIVRSTSDESPSGIYKLTLQSTDSDYNALHFPLQWGEVLAGGGSRFLKINKNGKLTLGSKYASNINIFRQLAASFDSFVKGTWDNGDSYAICGLKQWVNNVETQSEKHAYFPVYVKDNELSTKDDVLMKIRYLDNAADPTLFKLAKERLVDILRSVGIGFNIDELDFMLYHKYGTTDYKAMQSMLNSTDVSDSMSSFILFLNNIVRADGTLNISPDGKVTISGKQVQLAYAFSLMAFVKELANWKYEYRHSKDQLTVLATNDNKYYLISSNNYITDTIRELNKRGDIYQQLKDDPFVIHIEKDSDSNFTNTYGSVIIKQMEQDPESQIGVHNYVGFKTDHKDDYGSDYFLIGRREDYVSKAKILEDGGIIAPTLSDKKTWVYITGVKLPGLDYATFDENNVNIKLAELKILPADSITSDRDLLSLLPDVVQQFLEYAYTEYDQVKRADKILDDLEANGVKSELVKNYYTKDLAAKFSTLITVYEYVYNEDGTIKEEIPHHLNTTRNRKDLIADAEKYFFSKTREELEHMICRLLDDILKQELDTALKLGLITRNLQTGISDFLTYKNVGFNNLAILTIYNSLISKYGSPKDQISEERFHSLATVIYINDISNKSIMSGIEFERVFSGNPAFYKWKYNKEGLLVDRTVDELKRLGGIVSTGDNNFLELRDIPEKYLDENGSFTGKYVCAEAKDLMVQSQLYDILKDIMYESQLRYSAYSHVYDNSDDIDKGILDDYRKMSIKELEEYAKEKGFLDIVKQKAKLASDSYKMDDDNEGINVTDGGAYVTDTMCEMLLRMVGKYSSDIQLAFELLRNDNIDDVLGKAEAYNKIITTVIGTLKYTAFGRRKNALTGESIIYYNKYSLAPIFKCMTHGKLANIYNKMLEQGIDMLMMESAVKVGGQGAKSINFDDYRLNEDINDPKNYIGGVVKSDNLKPEFSKVFNFNTYEQEFKYLRKQLNTDPKDNETDMNIGSQFTKIALTSLFSDEYYTRQDGRVMSGHDILNDIMNTLNRLSDKGFSDIQKRFFLVDENGNIIRDANGRPVLDQVKFSKELTNMLSSRDANVNITRGIETHKVIIDGVEEEEMYLPLDAISDSKWLESVLISNINKKVIDVQTPGAAYVLRSIWAMEGLPMFESSNGGVLSDKQTPKALNGGKKLLMINEEGSMDCILSIDFFYKMLGKFDEYIVKDKNGKYVYDYVLDSNGNKIPILDENNKPKKTKDGKPLYKRKPRKAKMSFAEARLWLINNNIVGGKSNMIAYRIPTQALSSIHALRCVDIIPAVRDTIILPEEFTKTTGSDFDIDKLFISAIKYKINNVKDDNGIIHTSVTDLFETDSYEQLCNNLLRDYIAIAIDNRFVNVTKRSIDNDTDLIKNVLKYLESDKVQEVDKPYRFYSLSAQTEAKNDYITGKIGIGPFALNNNNHILTMQYNITFNGNIPILNVLGLTRLDRREDVDGLNIMSWLSAFINAHVDIAKDPYISRLNVNPFTYNIVNLLIRTGFGRNTLFFTTLPVMKELADVYTNAGALYMNDGLNSKYVIQNNAIDEYAENKFKDVEIGGRSFMETLRLIRTNGEYNKEVTDVRYAVSRLFKHLVDSGELMITAKSQEWNAFDQATVFLTYEMLKQPALSLSNLVKYCKIDTKKHGKSFSEQYLFKNKYDEFFDSFTFNNLDKLKELSYVGTKTENAIEIVKQVLGNLMIKSTPVFQRILASALAATGRDQYSQNLVDKFIDAISTAIKSLFFNEQYVPSISNNPNYIHDLVSESQERIQYTGTKNSNVIQVSGKMYHDLRSYVGGKVIMQYKDASGGISSIPANIVSVNTSANSIAIDTKLPYNLTGNVIIKGGKNTIFDRWNRLSIAILSTSRFSKLVGSDGNILNLLLQMLVPGKEYRYTQHYVRGEKPDIYDTLKFVKLFNMADTDSISSNYITQSWDELLNYTDEDNPEAAKMIRDFARDLVVYAFVTSGEKVGFTKMFRYVPVSWRKESHYGDFINSTITKYKSLVQDDINVEDILLNNWFDNDFVPNVSVKDKDGNPNYVPVFDKVWDPASKSMVIKYNFPVMIAGIKKENGVYKSLFEPGHEPRVIKTARNYKAYDSLRKYNLYKLYRMGIMKDGTEFPVYIKTNPKGNQISGNFLMTEYGRSDSYDKQFDDEYEVNDKALSTFIDALEFVDKLPLLENYYGKEYSHVLRSMSKSYEEMQHIENNKNPNILSEEELLLAKDIKNHCKGE